jgi:formylglycine-generating enzyme required for sulfatase activity/energy-coupling factor transporter ATP-binding protein EcfA2
VIANRRLVLLGAPGSGKSTFVKHLAYCLAQPRQESGGRGGACLPDWPEEESDLLPILITLGDFVRWARAQGDEAQRTLSRYLEDRLTGWELDDFSEPLRDALHTGDAMVFCDGLDEVSDAATRTFVRDAIQTFATTYQDVRIVVTCRTLSYQDPARRLPEDGFPVFELAPFTEEKVAHFIRAWYQQQFALGAVRRGEVNTRIAQLTAAAQWPEMAALASNPLLLTLMALIHTRQQTLPGVRALIYEECIDIMLWRWGRTKRETSGLHKLLEEVGLQALDLKHALWKLAFDLHKGDADRQGAEAKIAASDLWQALQPLHPDGDFNWVARVVTHLLERTGLLVEREEGVYTYPHRTFQEYLAGSYLSVKKNFALQAKNLVDEADFWREAVLLAVSRQVYVVEDLSRVLVFVGELCPAQCVDKDVRWRQVRLAGEVFLEMALDREQDFQLGRDLLARVRERLRILVEAGHLQARARAEAGDVLGRLGDPRFDSDGYHLTQQYHSEPEPTLGLVNVPAGPFVMGQGFAKHQPALPYDYWIARYPVTVAQYGCFVAQGGYDTSDYWTETGWAWRQGEWNSQNEDRYLQQDLEARTAEMRSAPWDWPAQQRYPTRPVVGVSWFEALAYSAWLAEQLQVGEAGGVETVSSDPAVLTVRLPSEAEWEKAARSGDDRRYPWGEAYWDRDRANIGRSGLGHATPVGMYPRGANAWGLHEMAGNVWEWTRSSWALYPYDAGDGREAVEAEGWRVLRGGAWHDDLDRARCAARVRRLPDQFGWDVGFRVVVRLDEDA